MLQLGGPEGDERIRAREGACRRAEGDGQAEQGADTRAGKEADRRALNGVCDCDRFLELWNLVFMQFNRSADGTMTKLPKPSIDTGMGLERVAAVLQGKFNNYESDLFTPIISRLEALSTKSYGRNNQDDTAMRVIADHARATTFLVADGVLPSNEGAGYVLRRIMRRAVRYGKHLGLEKPFMEEVCNAVVGEMADAYPHLNGALSLLAKVVVKEEERFRETLENGLTLLDEEVSRLTKENSRRISGGFIFKLYDTFGFPFDIVRDIALERGFGFDETGFLAEMENQRRKSRSSRKDEGVKLFDEGVKNLAAAGIKTKFVGYQELSTVTRVEGLLDDEGRIVTSLAVGQKGRLCVDQTPFYAEAGGQAGDCGEVRWEGGWAKVVATSVAGAKIILHDIEVREGLVLEKAEVSLIVDKDRRRAIAAHHSATHMLHAALRNLLGDHVKQAGSMVGPDRLRFDFTHFSSLTHEQIERIELLVNEQIWRNAPVTTRILHRDDALKEGAMALFGEKYEENVRVVSMADFSKELCGGTHVESSGEIGVCKVLSESGIASGVRRIEALAGPAAFAYIQAQGRRERQVAGLLNVGSSGEIAAKVETLLTHLKVMEKQIADLSRQLASSDLEGMLQNFVSIAGVKVVYSEIQLDSQKTLREIGDRLRDNLGSGVAVLGGSISGKAALLAVVTADLTRRIKAGDIINKVASLVGGKGGGRPDMAQAGGPMVDKLSEAIKSVPDVVRKLLQE
ncbi:MAG: alanine--tRNA ligase [Desulfobulbaceae bacterium]|nr:alanine--tRNA ligase [Desulfobulbaceae bacterium]